MKFIRTFLFIIAVLVSKCFLFGQSSNYIEFDFHTFTKNDTLVLMSEIMDCGEFGGHNEYIYISLAEKYKAVLRRDKPCLSKWAPKKKEKKYLNPDKPYKREIILTEESKNAILAYIEKFKAFQPKKDVVCNAMSYSKVGYRKRVAKINNLDCSWKEFIILRDKLFKNT